MCITLLPDFVTNKYCLVRGSAAERKKEKGAARRGRRERKGRERRRDTKGEGEEYEIKVDQELGVCLKIF